MEYKQYKPGCREILPIIFSEFIKSREAKVLVPALALSVGGVCYFGNNLLRSFGELQESEFCLKNDDRLPKCSTKKSEDILKLPVLQNLAKNADPKMQPIMTNTLKVISEMVGKSQIAFYEFNDQTSLGGTSHYGTLHDVPFFDVVIPQYDLTPADALGTRAHELLHIAKAELRRRAGVPSPYSSENKEIEEYEAQFFGDYFIYLARQNNLVSKDRQKDLTSAGIDFPEVTNYLLMKGYDAHSEVYQCVYDLSIRYIWKNQRSPIEILAFEFLTPEEKKAQLKKIEQRCQDPSKYAPKGSKEWDVIVDMQRRGLIASDFFPGLPQNINFNRTFAVDHKRLAWQGKGNGFKTTKGIPLAV